MIEKVDKRPRVVLAGVMALGVFGLPVCSEPASETSRVFPLNEQDLKPPTQAEFGRQAWELFTKPGMRGETFVQQGKRQITEGVRLYQEATGRWDLRINRGHLVLRDGSMHGLDTVDGMIKANALVEANLLKSFPEAADWWGRLPNTAFEDIEWVLQRVKISPLSTNFISPYDLVALVWGIRILELAGKPIPTSLAINPTKRPPDGTLIFRGEPYRDLAGFVLEQNPHLLEDYKKAVDEALARINQPLVRPDLTSISKYGYLIYPDSPKEEFLNIFASFLQNVDSIKKIIEYAKKAGFLEEAAVLEVKLGVIQKWLTPSLGMSLLQSQDEAFHPGCPECRSLFPK